MNQHEHEACKVATTNLQVYSRETDHLRRTNALVTLAGRVADPL